MRNPQVGKRGESPIVPAYLDEVHNFFLHNYPFPEPFILLFVPIEYEIMADFSFTTVTLQKFSKSAMWRHKNEVDEKRREKENP